MTTLNQNAEILAPAGSMEKLRTALHYGADAVYLGGKAYNLRAASQNFSKAQLEEAVQLVHGAGKKLYVTLNIIAHNRDLKGLPGFIEYLASLGVDAVIVADLGVMQLVREHSDLPIHISTQASVASWKTAETYYKLGAKRVVLARELSFDEISKIKDKVPELELEVFIHGAMCMTYSGRCNLSSYFSQRDSNHGTCSNTCRWKYALVEEKRPGKYYPVYEDDSGSFIYNSKDLCTVEFLDRVLATGVSGLKIEGRGRSKLYLATTIKTYRQALQRYNSGQWSIDPSWQEELESYQHRGYTSGFFFGKLDAQAHNLEGQERKRYIIAGEVMRRLDAATYEVKAHNYLRADAILQGISAQGPIQQARLSRMHTSDGNSLNALQPKDTAVLHLDMNLEAGDILRMPEFRNGASELQI